MFVRPANACLGVGPPTSPLLCIITNTQLSSSDSHLSSSDSDARSTIYRLTLYKACSHTTSSVPRYWQILLAMTKTTINTLNTFTNGSPEDTIALLNQSATISQTVLQHVFKWTSRELRDAATDTWRLIISPMGPDTADKRFPSQTENGKIKNHPNGCEHAGSHCPWAQVFSQGDRCISTGGPPPWTVIGTLPGDQDSRDGRVKHTFSEKWLQYAWTSGRPGISPRTKTEQVRRSNLRS